MVGWLRDWTGGFNAGWCFLGAVAALSLIITLCLKRSISSPAKQTRIAAAAN
jgi:cyanate permease